MLRYMKIMKVLNWWPPLLKSEKIVDGGMGEEADIRKTVQIHEKHSKSAGVFCQGQMMERH